MRKSFTLVLLAVIAIVFFAFNSEIITHKDNTTKTGGDDPTKDPNFASNKKNFALAYNEYNNRLSRGIVGVVPIDPSGTFMVDRFGNFVIKHQENNWDAPLPFPTTTDIVSGYTFTQPVTAYSAIVGTIITSGAIDDGSIGALPIGFTFTYDGTAYTQFGCGYNGEITMGAGVPYGNNYVGLNSTGGGAADNNMISAGEDLQGYATGRIEYLTTGVVGSRILTVQWSNWGFYNVTAEGTYTFQIKLFETSNNIQIVYGACAFGVNTNLLSVGLRGASIADFIDRTTTTNWAATTAGGLVSSTCQFSSGIVPATNLTFQWAPPAASPMTYVSSTTVQYQNGVPAQQNAVNQIVNQVQVVTSGSTSPFTVTSLSLGTNGSTNPATDISNAKVYYTGTSSTFATTTLFGTTASPSGTYSVAGSQVLAAGTNYFWVTYDEPLTATYLNILDGQCNSITGSGAMGTVVPTIIAPAGSRFVEKSTLGYGGYGNNGSPFNLYISNVTFGTINNSSVFDPNGNWYSATYPYNLAYASYFGTVPSVAQGSSYPISVSEPSASNANGFAVWVDWNQNGSFADAGEYYNLGLLPSGGVSTIAGSIGVPLGATLGNTRMRVRSNFSTVPTSTDWNNTSLVYGETEDYMVNVTAATSMVYVSSTTTQTVLTGFFTPQTNLQIAGVQVVTNGALSPLSLTSLTLNTNGSTSPATDITNAKVWYTGLSSTFATTTQVGGTFSGPNGSFVVSGSQVLQSGTNYFWMTYDLPNTATTGDFVDVECNSIDVGGAQTPTVQAPAGNRQILGSTMCGVYTVPGSYPTVAACIADINLRGINCSVTVNVAAGYTETAANLQLNVTGTSGSTITFQKSGAGANPLITAGVGVSTLTDAFIKFNGCNYITIDGIDLQENATNVTTTTMMEYGFWFTKPDGTHGNSNNTVRNCNITLNKINTQAYGIYFSNLNTAFTTQTVTSIAGANSNNTIQNCTFTNVYDGVYVNGYADVSPFTFYDLNNTITGCSVTNFGGQGTTAYGIYAYYQNNLSCTNNVVNGTAGTIANSLIYGLYMGLMNNSNLTLTGNTVTLATNVASASVYGMYVGAGSSGTTNNVNVSNNTVQNCNLTALTSGIFYGIYTTFTSNNLTISGNKVIGNTIGTAATTTTSSIYLMYNTNSAISTITYTNNLDSANVLSGTSAYVTYCMYNSVSTNAAVVTGNRIVNNTLCGTTAAGTTYGIYSGAGTFTNNMSNNVVSNNSLPTTSSQSMYMMYNFSPAPTEDYSSNTVQNNTGTGTGTFYNMYFGGSPAAGSVVNIQNNTISGNSKTTATGTGGIYGLYHGGSCVGTINITGNSITNQSSAAATLLAGIYQIGSPPNYLNILNNTVNNLTNGGISTIYGIYNNPASTTQTVESNNVVSNITSAGSTIYGMYVVNSLYMTISRNRIFGITTSTSTTATAYGIYDAIALAGGNIYIYNNYISDINTPASTSTAPAIGGIYIASGSATTNVYLYYNTVFLKATSTGTSFGTAAVYALTTPFVELRNNCLVDMSTPGSISGVTCAYRRSSNILTTYGANSNNNCLYAGAPAANHLIYYDVTNSDQTLAAFKNRVTPRDQVSVSENPPFINSASTPYDLHINTGVPTSLESGGQVISSPIAITTDWDANARYPNAGYPVGGFTPIAPDIGADEFGGLNLDVVPPSITYVPLGPGGTTNRAFPNVTITDASGVNTTIGTKPRCYYKRSIDGNTIVDNTSGTDGWKYVESNGTTTPFDFTIDYSLLIGGTGVVAGQFVQYFVIAQDLVATPNVGWNAGVMTVNPSTVALTAANCPINSTGQYTIVSSVFSGTYDVGTGWPYTTLTGVGGLFAAVNAGVVGGNITALIHTDITEPGTNQLLQTNETGAGGYTVTLVPSDASLKTISGSVAATMIAFNGVDRIVIDGNGGFDASGKRVTGVNDNIKAFDHSKNSNILGENDLAGTPKYLLFRNTNGSNPTFSFINDSRNNTIKNCYIESNNTSSLTTTAGTINFGTTTGPQGNDSNTIFQCDIRDRSDAAGTPAFGIYCSGTTTNVNTYNSYNTISSCNIYNNFYDAAVTQGALFLNLGATDWVITGNSFYQTVTRNVAVSTSVFASVYNNNSANCNNNQITNNYVGGSGPLCSGTAMTYTGSTAYSIYGIQGFVSVLVPEVIQGNTIKNINLTTTGAATVFFKAIYAQTGWINVVNNTIGSQTANDNIVLNPNSATSCTVILCHVTAFGNVTGNTIGGVTFGGTSTATANSLQGMQIVNSIVGTYNYSNNIFGSPTVPNSVQQVSTVTGNSLRGMVVSNGAGTTNNVNNNTFTNITDFSTSASFTCSNYGIQASGAGIFYFGNNNVNNLTVNLNVATASFMLLGINSTATGFNYCTQNNVHSLYALGSGTGAVLIGGILAGGTSGGTVSQNIMYDFKQTGTGVLAPSPLNLGINCQSTGLYTINNNIISLTNGDATDSKFTELINQQNQVNRKNMPDNTKYGPTVIPPQNTRYTSIDMPAAEVLTGDKLISGANAGNVTEVKHFTSDNSNSSYSKNNSNSKPGIIKDEINATVNCLLAGVYHTNTSPGTHLYYYNTFYIGGSQPGGSFNSYCFVRTGNGSVAFRNNLFVNARTGGSGNQYCLGNEAPTPSFGWTASTSNYNVFLAVNDATVGDWGAGNPQTIAQWRVSSGGDNQSWQTNTTTINPSNLFVNLAGNDLHINSANVESWLVSGKGIALGGYNVDYDNQSRYTAITGGCTDIGADELGNPGVNPPFAVESAVPAAGTTTLYTLWGRTIAQVDWGVGGIYPGGLRVAYYTGINPSNTLGGNYSNSHTTITPYSGAFSGSTYNITYFFGDNETYTITSPSINTVLAKYDPSAWEVYQPGTNPWQTQLTYNTSAEIFTAKVTGLSSFSDFALTDVSSPLPVDITSFTAGVTNRDITLNWTTGHEVNNRGFDVERRVQTDANTNTYSDWQRVAFRDGHGTTNQSQNYSLKDLKLSTGKYQYRLKQIDYNSNYEYYELHSPDVVDIGRPQQADVSQNYPNPSNPKSKIDFQIPFTGKVSLKVYDVTGREVTTIVNEVKEAGFYTAEFDGSNLASGVYFYRMLAEGDGQKFVETKKMILVK